MAIIILVALIKQEKFLSLEVKHKKFNVYAIEATMAMINIIEQKSQENCETSNWNVKKECYILVHEKFFIYSNSLTHSPIECIIIMYNNY